LREDRAEESEFVTISYWANVEGRAAFKQRFGLDCDR
jgi:hypothetical protein